MNIYSDIEAISKNFKGILLDAYGVFWGGNQTGPLSGAISMMEQLVRSGKVVGVLSNSTQLAEKEIAKLRAKGIIQGEHFHFLVTSGEVARSIFLKNDLPFASPRKRFFVVGGMNAAQSSHPAIFQGTSFHETAHISEADFLYLTVPQLDGVDQTDPEVFRPQMKALQEFNLPLVCANPDRFAHEGNPPQVVVRQGSLAALYEELEGKVFYIGKPHAPAFAQAMEQFKGLQRSDILMVGDTPETDIRGARQFGFATALLTKTGMLAERIAHQGYQATLTALPPEDMPDFLAERLGSFELHPNLKEKIFIADLPLCRVLLEDEAHYPWIFLVPRRLHISRMMDLSVEDQGQLSKELDQAQRILMELFQPTQLNVAAIGNKTPQLHVHLIARNSSDPAWPQTVWDHPVRLPYTEEQRAQRIVQLKMRFTKSIHDPNLKIESVALQKLLQDAH